MFSLTLSSRPLYGGRLLQTARRAVDTPGRDDSERALMINQTAFKLPKNGNPPHFSPSEHACPARRGVHIFGQSGPNRHSDESPLAFGAGLPGTLIRCICFYAAQALEIERLVAQQEIPDILVTTADATQGHESVTCRRRHNMFRLRQCSRLAAILGGCRAGGRRHLPCQPWNDHHRRLAAAQPKRRRGGDTWTKRTTETTVVGPEYFDFEQFNNPDNYYDKDGQLISANGGAVRSEHFYSKYGKMCGTTTPVSQGGWRTDINLIFLKVVLENALVAKHHFWCAQMNEGRASCNDFSHGRQPRMDSLLLHSLPLTFCHFYFCFDSLLFHSLSSPFL
ncbi:hypothetical protein niasHT_014550 [Heterodera trifolii]|uniref:Uncharacterized protein n=1 Tax=Heterodera trifolii TaxID=157864 RepID=A0ABD2L3F2_9BILA